MTDGSEFCGHCGITWTLHPNPTSRKPEPWECDSALDQVDRLYDQMREDHAQRN